MLSFAFTALLSTTLASSSSCPSGWTDANHINGLGCILFNGTVGYSWSDAASYCWSQDKSHLVEIFSIGQQEFLVGIAQVLEMVQGPKSWWIGATDANREGQWYWSHSLEEVGYSDWAEPQPDNS